MKSISDNAFGITKCALVSETMGSISSFVPIDRIKDSIQKYIPLMKENVNLEEKTNISKNANNIDIKNISNLHNDNQNIKLGNYSDSNPIQSLFYPNYYPYFNNVPPYFPIPPISSARMAFDPFDPLGQMAIQTMYINPNISDNSNIHLPLSSNKKFQPKFKRINKKKTLSLEKSKKNGIESEEEYKIGNVLFYKRNESNIFVLLQEKNENNPNLLTHFTSIRNVDEDIDSVSTVSRGFIELITNFNEPNSKINETNNSIELNGQSIEIEDSQKLNKKFLEKMLRNPKFNEIVYIESIESYLHICLVNQTFEEQIEKLNKSNNIFRWIPLENLLSNVSNQENTEKKNQFKKSKYLGKQLKEELIQLLNDSNVNEILEYFGNLKKNKQKKTKKVNKNKQNQTNKEKKSQYKM